MTVVYVGSVGDGITLCRQDPETGSLRSRGLAARVPHPSYLARHPTGPYLYAVSELADGAVHAFAIGPSGELRPLGAEPTGGADPCHLTVDHSGRYVLVANYTGGSVAVFPVGPDGGVCARTDLVQHSGTGPDPERQAGPHPHMVAPEPTGRYVVVPDLGADQLVLYTVDDGLRPRLPTARTPAGAGPRHLVFHPTNGYAYVACELDSTVATFRVQDGLSSVDSLPATALPVAADGRNYPSGIEVSPDGRFLYVANRGADCLTVSAIEGHDLRPVADVPTGGTWPRHVALVGDFVYVANQRSDEVTVFRRNRRNGLPEPTGHSLAVPSPACVCALDR